MDALEHYSDITWSVLIGAAHYAPLAVVALLIASLLVACGRRG